MIALALILFSTIAFSQENEISVLIGEITPIVEVCDETIPERCHHLSREVCPIQKTKPARSWEINEELAKKHITTLPDDSSAFQIARAQQQAIKEAEVSAQVYAEVTWNEISTLVNEVKSTMLSEIKSGPMPEVVKGRMVEKIGSIKFVNANEYIGSMKKWFIDNQKLPPAQAETEATKFYTGSCGKQGMASNAFYHSPVKSFVLCPGLIQSASEYGTSKSTFLNGLSFTIGHELGHAIDSGLYPVSYTKMGECHESAHEFDWSKQGGEISGDFWGARVLGERMKQQQITDEEAMKTISVAEGSLCAGKGGEVHPPGTKRIDTITGRDPQIRAQLGCPLPTQAQPYCGFNGLQGEP